MYFLPRKQFTHFICREKPFMHFFVAKTTYGLCPESFCALIFAIRKVHTFWASLNSFIISQRTVEPTGSSYVLFFLQVKSKKDFDNCTGYTVAEKGNPNGGPFKTSFDKVHAAVFVVSCRNFHCISITFA